MLLTPFLTSIVNPKVSTNKEMKQLKKAISNSGYREKTEKERQLRFWKDDQKYLKQKNSEGKFTVRFWLYKKVVFTIELNTGLICQAIKTDRYKEDQKDKAIIDFAIKSLSGKEDGVWYFNVIDNWYKEPLPDILIESLKFDI